MKGRGGCWGEGGEKGRCWGEGGEKGGYWGGRGEEGAGVKRERRVLG